MKYILHNYINGLMAVALMSFCVFGLTTQVAAQGEPLPTLDFEEGGAGLDWEWVVFENEDNPPVIFIDNPDPSGINESATVAEFTARAAGASFAGTTGFGPEPFLMEPGSNTITIMVWKSKISNVGLKLETASGWSQGEILIENTVVGEWEAIEFDFSDFENPPAGETFVGLTVFPDFEERDEDAIVYFDNISFEGFLTAEGDNGGDPGAPPTPIGFVVSDMVGENPVGPGEIFLAAGANDVGGDIEYRMFYSLSDEAPSDPRDATEYEFGSTEGDGNGVNAFGFTVGDLTPGAEYTFWLYQYNTAEDLFSNAASGSANAGEQETSIGDDGERPTDLSLDQNYPNPFNPTTQITFTMPESGNARLDVYNMMGQRISTVVDQTLSAGSHTVTFDANNLASGVYLYRLQAGNTVLTRSMTLVK